MRDDLTVIYAKTLDDAHSIAEQLTLAKANYMAASSRSPNALRGYSAKQGLVILVDDVELKLIHRRDLSLIFLANPPILRVQRIGHVS